MHLPEFEEPFDPDSRSKMPGTEVPEAIRRDVEQHVSDNLPADLLTKLCDLHARGIAIRF